MDRLSRWVPDRFHVRIKHLTAMIIFASSLTHCSGEKSCTTQANWSFRVYVEDAVTGASICDATVNASQGSEDTQLTCLGGTGCPCVGVTEQLGTFQITAAKSGYQIGAVTIIVDQSDGCHVVTKDVTVKLNPQ